MSDKQIADIICRALLMIVSAIRKRYGLPDYHNLVLFVPQEDACAELQS